MLVSIRSSLHSVRFGQLLACYAVHINASIVNIMKVYMERKNMQIELIRLRKKYRLYSSLHLRGKEFNATRVFTLG